MIFSFPLAVLRDLRELPSAGLFVRRLHRQLGRTCLEAYSRTVCPDSRPSAPTRKPSGIPEQAPCKGSAAGLRAPLKPPPAEKLRGPKARQLRQRHRLIGQSALRLGRRMRERTVKQGRRRRPSESSSARAAAIAPARLSPALSHLLTPLRPTWTKQKRRRRQALQRKLPRRRCAFGWRSACSLTCSLPRGLRHRPAVAGARAANG